jgi:predicted GNAT family N-acyltransferase
MIDGSGSILGYYTLSAFGVQSGELPDYIARKLPRYPLLPATLLGRLAVRQSQQGQGLGHFLLVDALRRSLDSTYNVASIGVVVEALDENASTFYKRHGFTELNDHPSRLFLPMATIEKAFKVR